MQTVAAEVAADVEFLSVTECLMLDGKVPNMSELQDAYTNIRSANNVANPKSTRKQLKALMQAEIPGLEFNKPKRVNEPERVTIKRTKDAAINLLEESDTRLDATMTVLYNAASLLRKALGKVKKWKFTGTFSDVTEDHVPMELYAFYRWVLQGPNTTLSTDGKSAKVNINATSLAQSTVTMYLSNQQVRNKTSLTFRATREMPQQLAIGVAIRQATRSKQIVNMLYKFGVGVEYNRLLRLEAQICSTVIERMLVNDGLYLPPDVIRGRYIFFAIDNVDFAEDTPDGKRTLHATAMAIYQRCQPEDVVPRLEVAGPALNRSLKELPGTVTGLLECPKPASKPCNPVHASFSLHNGMVPSSAAHLPDIAWLLCRTMSRSTCDHKENEEPKILYDPLPQEDRAVVPQIIPTWYAYNSLISDKLPTTRVGSPPLIPAPAHEWQTLLTVLMQAQGINAKVVGPGRKTVISLDMGLYKPAKQLQMARKDLDQIVLRPGELHIVMAQLRCMGNAIENSGIDFCWTEADLYGPATVKQILEGRHVKRGVEAHMITLQALFMLHRKSFLEARPDMLEELTSVVEDLVKAFVSSNDSLVERQQAHSRMVQTIENEEVMKEISQLDSENAAHPLSAVMLQYMQMIMEMMLFIRAVRTGDWELHLVALEAFMKHFFAHDKLVYSRMIPLYLADMAALREAEKDIYQEFLEGNWVVNKNSHVSFCAIGADHALEHINRSMKVAVGLVGITLDPSARTKFFLIAPEVARLSEEAKEMAGMSSPVQQHHHAATSTVLV